MQKIDKLIHDFTGLLNLSLKKNKLEPMWSVDYSNSNNTPKMYSAFTF